MFEGGLIRFRGLLKGHMGAEGGAWGKWDIWRSKR